MESSVYYAYHDNMCKIFRDFGDHHAWDVAIHWAERVGVYPEVKLYRIENEYILARIGEGRECNISDVPLHDLIMVNGIKLD